LLLLSDVTPTKLKTSPDREIAITVIDHRGSADSGFQATSDIAVREPNSIKLTLTAD
jgi:hypothetical protein